MKKSLIIVGAALALAGCGRDQGATSDQYQTDRGSGSSVNTTSSTIRATSDSLAPAPGSQGTSQNAPTAAPDTSTSSTTNSDTASPDSSKPAATP
jgi:hypothetical protein